MTREAVSFTLATQLLSTVWTTHQVLPLQSYPGTVLHVEAESRVFSLQLSLLWTSTLTSGPTRHLNRLTVKLSGKPLQGTKLNSGHISNPRSAANTHVATLVHPCTLVIHTKSLQLRIWVGPQAAIMADGRHFAACRTSAASGGQEGRQTTLLRLCDRGFRLYDDYTGTICLPCS